MDISRIYIERAIEKCLRPNFLTPWKPRNSKNKSVYSFAGHPVVQGRLDGTLMEISGGFKVA